VQPIMTLESHPLEPLLPATSQVAGLQAAAQDHTLKPSSQVTAGILFRVFGSLFGVFGSRRKANMKASTVSMKSTSSAC